MQNLTRMYNIEESCFVSESEEKVARANRAMCVWMEMKAPLPEKEVGGGGRGER